MRLQNYLLMLTALFLITGCGDDDDDDGISIRDRGEVYEEDIAEIEDYLATHFYNYEEFEQNPGENLAIVFDVIEGDNADKIPLSQQVTETVLRRDDIDYRVFTLKVHEGGGDMQPSFADSVLVSYQVNLLDGSSADSSPNPIWFDLTSVVDGFMEAITQFNNAASIISNGDGTISITDPGIGAAFIPSGLGYFNQTQSGIPAYSPIIFRFQTAAVRVTDHDGDGILSKFEDLDGDRGFRTEEDNTDDDTRTTSGGFQVPRYNYLDQDDDGDGILTINEQADPNGDGNPDDAVDTDGDGIPDYLDNRTE